MQFINKRKKLMKKELKKVKSLLIGNTKLSLESTDDIASFYGSQELMKGEIKTLGSKIKRNKYGYFRRYTKNCKKYI